jgi:hypothetical protein
MNVKKNIQNNGKRTALHSKKAGVHANRIGNRVQRYTPITSKNELVATEIKSKINRAISQISRTPAPPGFSEFTRQLLHSGQKQYPTPLESRKMFYKRVRYQDTLEVNANGSCFVGGSLAGLVIRDKTSTNSTLLYSNASGYDPTSTGNSIVGGWNTDIIGPSGLNLDKLAFTRAVLQSAHLKISVTGVSNLNKQGQIHIMEDMADVVYSGTSSSTLRNNELINEYPVQDLPKSTHYKRVDVMNMDSSSQMEYHFIPQRLYSRGDRNDDIITAYASTDLSDLKDTKNFAIICTSCAVGTTLRLEYEFNIALEVENDYINDYPPIWSTIYINPDPTLMMLQQDTNKIIKVDRHGENYITINNKRKPISTNLEYNPHGGIM